MSKFIKSVRIALFGETEFERFQRKLDEVHDNIMLLQKEFKGYKE
ncbi:hypothetical protein MHH85_05030 [Viridibacillus sp. FSL E2-0187]